MSKERHHILIVDDSILFTQRLKTLLRESGNVDEIKTVDNYDDALRCLSENQPDLIFLDIHLQKKSGIDLLKVIRLSQWNCKVVMLTNETKYAYRKQCEQLGTSGFLDKSNDFDKIPALVDVLY